jgi:signal transduction histidine kinase
VIDSHPSRAGVGRAGRRSSATRPAGRAGPGGPDGAGGRLPPAVEGAVYFVCAEALTNIAKHANATWASVGITVDNEAVIARIVDNGNGGADRNGSGLRGLADRVEALGG